MSNDVDSFSGTWSGGVTYSLQPNQNAKGFVQVLWGMFAKGEFRKITRIGGRLGDGSQTPTGRPGPSLG